MKILVRDPHHVNGTFCWVPGMLSLSIFIALKCDCTQQMHVTELICFQHITQLDAGAPHQTPQATFPPTKSSESI